MTPLPKRRSSSHRQGKRRSQIKLTKPNLIPCPHCGKPTLPHRVCPHCSYYAGRSTLASPPATTKSDKQSKSSKKS